MARFSLSRYETQARFGLLIALVALLCLLGQVGVTLNVHKGFEGLDREQWIIRYGHARKLGVYAATAVTIAAAVIAVGFGYNSAGQRRNDRPGMSWAAFFIGASVVCGAVIVFMIFRFRGESVIG